MSVLVVGAGELGTAILEALAAHPQRKSGKIAVLLRKETANSVDPTKRAAVDHLRSLGIAVETGDYVDAAAALVPVFERYHVVIQAAGYGMKPGTQASVTKAVLGAGVERYFPWQFGVDYEMIGKGSAQDLFDEQLEVRALLRSQSKTKWTIISTGLFMSYLFMPEFGPVDIPKSIVRALGSWDNRVTVTHPKDVGTMVAEAVFVPEGTLDRVVYIGGETLSYEQLASHLNAVSGTEFTREVWDVGYLRDKLLRGPDDIWTKYQNIFGDGTGVSWDVEKTLNYQRRIPLLSVKTYMEAQRGKLWTASG